MRGQRTYHSLFPDVEEQEDTLTDKKKGRNADLIDQRNDLLAHRLAWYRLFYKQLSYDDVLEKLVLEFQIAPFTIGDLLLKMASDIRAIQMTEPSRDYFRKKFSWWVW